MTGHPSVDPSPRPPTGDPTPGRLPVTVEEIERLRAAVEANYPEYLAYLERLVAIDSGSYTRSGVNEVGALVAERLEALGASIERLAGSELGDTWVATFVGPPAGPTVLLIGHADTVFEVGTAASRPFRIEGGRALGPGVSDMKGGLLLGVGALAALRSVMADRPDWLPVGRLRFVIDPDEEIGSPSSTPTIRRLAAEADVALVLESARANGDIVSARKGMLDVRVDIIGRAAHAGVEPEKGRSAILEAAHKTIGLHDLDRRWDDVTVNVGIIAGGSRPNIVPDAASLTLDVRAATRDHLDAAEAAVAEIVGAARVPEVSATSTVLARHQPMERSAGGARLVGLAGAIAQVLGFELRDTATGGASDANTTAALGVPTIDGLGPIGGHDHAPGEYIELDSVVPRTTMLAALLLALGQEPEIWTRGNRGSTPT